MDYFKRIALLFLFCIPTFMSGLAHADYSKTFLHYELVGWGYTNSSNQAVCDYFLNAKKTAYPNENVRYGSCSETQVWLYYNSYDIYSASIKKWGSCSGVVSEWGNGMCTGTCAAGYTLTNGKCEPPPQCNAPLVLDPATNTCVDPCKPKEGQATSYFTVGQSWPYACQGGCVVQGSSGDCGTNSAGTEGCFYVGTFTGVSCQGSEGNGGTPTSDPPPDQPEYDCIKQGMSYGTVNGTTVCVSSGTKGSAPTTSTSAGTKTTTTNPDGTKTTTTSPETTTSVDPDTQQVTVTQTAEDGTKTETKQDFKNFCTDNPSSPICKEHDKGSYSGSCVDGVASVSCDGDAAACAIARQQAEANCKFFKPDANFENKFNELQNGISDNPAAAANRINVNLPATLDASGSAGECPPDVVVTLLGQSATLPISNWCPYLTAIGYIALAMSYLVAARMLAGSV